MQRSLSNADLLFTCPVLPLIARIRPVLRGVLHTVHSASIKGQNKRQADYQAEYLSQYTLSERKPLRKTKSQLLSAFIWHVLLHIIVRNVFNCIVWY